MSYTRVFSDEKLKQEFLDRFNDLVSARTQAGGLESLEVIPTRDDAERATKRMSEGTWRSEVADGGFEAIILRFTRPVQLIQDQTFKPPADTFPESEVIVSRLQSNKGQLEAVIPSAGRVEVTNHRLSWLGTAWMVKPNVIITNRHVAEEFARGDAAGFNFRKNILGKQMKASVDWRREWDRPDESVFRVKKVLWIEPDESFDVALLEVEQENDDGHKLPRMIELATLEELKQHQASSSWAAVVGYPAQDSRNDASDQQRIFDGIYNVKRLAPGQITAIRPDGLLTHDATTLGGNSGSAVIDVATGKALALHFGGVEGQANFAVQAPKIKDLVDQHAP
jgi:V8-like Glu-specific endopeptidase